MRVVDGLTLLAFEGPQARAYLWSMREAGLKPERVIRAVPHNSSEMRFLPGFVRNPMLIRKNDLSMNHWPRSLAVYYPGLWQKMETTLQRSLGLRSGALTEIYTGFDWSNSPADETLFCSGIKCEKLQKKIESLPKPGVVLYSGGGIVPPGLLSIKGIRFLHIHPGKLPDIRGADGMLWSYLMRGKPGMSAFFMLPEIDTGALLLAEELDPVTVREIGPRPEDIMLYRAIFAAVDPFTRAWFLINRIFKTFPDLRQAVGQEQDLSQGLTFHFMHPRLRARGLEILFPS